MGHPGEQFYPEGVHWDDPLPRGTLPTAASLGISERTVKAHLTSAFQRIGVVDRTQAALWAERHGV